METTNATATGFGLVNRTGRFSVKCLWCKKRFVTDDPGANSPAKQAHKLTCEPFKARRWNELRNFTMDEILGSHNPTVACSPKCTGAVGPSCDCSCAGENHGRG